MSSIEFVSEGRGALVCITQEMLDETGASLDDTEGISGMVRNIAGVEISAVLKENEPEKVKVSMRAKTTANVGAICRKFGGGGHIKAAGYTYFKTIDQTKAELKEAIIEELK